MNYKKIQVRTLEILDQAEGNDLTSKVCDYFILGRFSLILWLWS
ncbi:hypothetical protein N9C16_05385 [Paracoccaceae bacterium]|nr:hypothetical protein [Paracoccaceae bacterium]